MTPGDSCDGLTEDGPVPGYDDDGVAQPAEGDDDAKPGG